MSSCGADGRQGVLLTVAISYGFPPILEAGWEKVGFFFSPSFVPNVEANRLGSSSLIQWSPLLPYKAILLSHFLLQLLFLFPSLLPFLALDPALLHVAQF